MKISIKLKSDSHNTHAPANLELSASNELITLKIDDSDREVSVSKEELLRALLAFERRAWNSTPGCTNPNP